MCLAVIAWRVHPRFPLLVAANRDEFHSRPAAPLAEWAAPAAILAGRDLQAGGTWLGVDRRGRFGLVTNFRERLRPRRNAPSRGELIPQFLAGAASPADYLAALETDAPGYSGFNLLLADDSGLWYACNREDRFARPLPTGIYGLANHLLDTPWPKLVLTRRRVADFIEAHAAADPSGEQDVAAAAAALLAILADRAPGPEDPVLTTGLPPAWERALSAPFVVHPDYGTRCSTVLLGDPDGRLLVIERRFAPDGSVTGESQRTIETRNPGGPRPL